MQAEGDLSERARKRAAELVADADLRVAPTPNVEAGLRAVGCLQGDLRPHRTLDTGFLMKKWSGCPTLDPKPRAGGEVILPQATRVILPPTTNDLVALFKDTSVVSVVALDPPELTKQYLMLTKSGVHVVEVALATAALYLIMSVPLGYLSRYLEKRWAKNV